MRDYAELVKALRCFNVNYDSNKLTNDAADSIEELLKEVQSRENDCINLTGECATYYAQIPKWISVEDELPDVASEVLCYSPFYDCSYTAAFDGERWWHFGGFGTDPIRFKVTHWMPLPEAPKEDAE